MNNINCSVVLVSRERPKRLKGCIVKIYEKAKYPNTVECLVRVDEDDKDTIHMFKTDKDFRIYKNLRVFVGQRVGFDYDAYVYALKLLIRKEDYRHHLGRNCKDWARLNLNPEKWVDIIENITLKEE